jgi:hypothetical protein
MQKPQEATDGRIGDQFPHVIDDVMTVLSHKSQIDLLANVSFLFLTDVSSQTLNHACGRITSSSIQNLRLSPSRLP